MKRIEINCSTGQQMEIELTDQEIAQLKEDWAVADREEQIRVKAEADRQTKRVEIAKRLGITADELNLLLK